PDVAQKAEAAARYFRGDADLEALDEAVAELEGSPELQKLFGNRELRHAPKFLRQVRGIRTLRSVRRRSPVRQRRSARTSSRRARGSSRGSPRSTDDPSPEPPLAGAGAEPVAGPRDSGRGA